MEFGLDGLNCSGFNDYYSSLSEEEYGSRIAYLHALPEHDSPGYDMQSPSSGHYESLSYSWSADALSEYSVPLGQRHTDLEMAMGPYSDGYLSGIEGGKACQFCTCSDLVNV